MLPMLSASCYLREETPRKAKPEGKERLRGGNATKILKETSRYQRDIYGAVPFGKSSKHTQQHCRVKVDAYTLIKALSA